MAGAKIKLFDLNYVIVVGLFVLLVVVVLVCSGGDESMLSENAGRDTTRTMPDAYRTSVMLFLLPKIFTSCDS